ncbi:MAG: hypothetical protein HY744_06285 [Deltaproteobacteria bacterium]|nr:hypothetical protein [Deltaproteobacteria bacterium]
MSFYAYDRTCSVLELTVDDYVQVRNGLIDKDLIGFDGTRFQVLSLPVQPVVHPARPLLRECDLEDRDPATIRCIVRSALGPRQS